MKRSALCLAACLLAAACEREQRPTKAPPAASSIDSHSYASVVAPVKNHYEENAYAVSQGQTLFRAYNCAGCHSGGGGGGMGPPLMDARWRYGSDPASIFQSIAQGRPNGMPAFGQHVPEDQIWQLVAFVRSLSGQLREDVAPTRTDSLGASKPISRRKQEQPVHEPTPAAE